MQHIEYLGPLAIVRNTGRDLNLYFSKILRNTTNPRTFAFTRCKGQPWQRLAFSLSWNTIMSKWEKHLMLTTRYNYDTIIQYIYILYRCTYVQYMDRVVSYTNAIQKGRCKSPLVGIPAIQLGKVGCMQCTNFNWHTVDASEIRRSPVELGSVSCYWQGFVNPRWCRISSINSSTTFQKEN